MPMLRNTAAKLKPRCHGCVVLYSWSQVACTHWIYPQRPDVCGTVAYYDYPAVNPYTVASITGPITITKTWDVSAVNLLEYGTNAQLVLSCCRCLWIGRRTLAVMVPGTRAAICSWTQVAKV